jgi:hypothetical protein
MSPAHCPLPAPPLPEERAVFLRTYRCTCSPRRSCARTQALLVARHYLGGVQAVGEQLH